MLSILKSESSDPLAAAREKFAALQSRRAEVSQRIASLSGAEQDATTAAQRMLASTSFDLSAAASIETRRANAAKELEILDAALRIQKDEVRRAVEADLLIRGERAARRLREQRERVRVAAAALIREIEAVDAVRDETSAEIRGLALLHHGELVLKAEGASVSIQVDAWVPLPPIALIAIRNLAAPGSK